MPRLTKDQITRLANDIRDKILSREALIAESEGKITIQTHPRGDGYDIELTIKTR